MLKTKMVNQGLKHVEVLKLQHEYYQKLAKVTPTADAAEYLEKTRGLYGITGNLDAAKAATPEALKIDKLLGKNASDDLYRSIEMKGLATDPKKAQEVIDTLYPLVAVSGGKIKPGDLTTFSKRAGTAWMNMNLSDPLSAAQITTAIQNQGPDTSGTSLATLNQVVGGGRTMTKQQFAMWKQLGLIDMTKVTEQNFGRVQMGLGAVKGALEHGGDLPGLVRDVIYPAVASAAHNDPKMIEQIMNKMFPDRNSRRQAYEFGEPEFVAQARRDMANAVKVPTVDQGYENLLNNPKDALDAFWKQWKSFQEALGAPMMQSVVPFLRDMTSVISDLGAAADLHPQLAASLATATGGALGGAALGAGIGILGGPAGIAAGMAIGAIAGAVTGLAAANWGKVVEGFNYIKSQAFSDDVVRINDMIGAWLRRLPAEVTTIIKTTNWSALGNQIMAGLTQMIQEIATRIKASFPSLFGDAPGEPTSSVFDRMRRGSPPPADGSPSPFDHRPYSLVPPPRDQPVVINNSVMLDGRKMAQIVTGQMVSNSTYPTSAAGADSARDVDGAELEPDDAMRDIELHTKLIADGRVFATVVSLFKFDASGSSSLASERVEYEGAADGATPGHIGGGATPREHHARHHEGAAPADHSHRQRARHHMAAQAEHGHQGASLADHSRKQRDRHIAEQGASPGHVAHDGRHSGSTNQYFTKENAQAIRESAKRLGTTPEDLATVIAYETGGTFSPGQWGGKGGRYAGLIQFGPTERAQYGAHPGQSFTEQMGAVERYLKGRGFKPGMGIKDLYSTVNAGSPGHYHASDKPGETVETHVNRMIRERSGQARRFLASGGDEAPASTAHPVPAPLKLDGSE